MCEIKAVFFDLDGVLVDAASWHKEAFDAALMHYGYNPIGQQDHLDNFNGLSTKRKIEILVKRGEIKKFTKRHYNAINRKKQGFTKEIIRKRCTPIKRIQDVVDWANKNIGKTAVVTNCSRETCELMLAEAGLEGKFDLIITNSDVDGKIKPHPWPYLLARYYFGLKDKDALAIDDTSKGIASALNAQCSLWHLKNFDSLTVNNLKNIIEGLKVAL